MSRQAIAQTTSMPVITPMASTILQRACACGRHSGSGGECAECRKKREGTLQRAAVNSGPANTVPPIVHEVLRSPGQPLDANTRAFMEPRFGHDFSGVRARTPVRVANSAQDELHRTAGAVTILRKAFVHRQISALHNEEPTNGQPQPEQESANQEQLDMLCVRMRPGEGPTRRQFTDRELQRLSAARYAARSLTSQALLALSSGDPYLRTVAQRVFHTSNLDLDEATTTVSSILDALRNTPIVCGTCADETCYRGGVVAYVMDDLSTIVICPRCFLLSVAGIRSTLIHEAGHAVGIDSSLVDQSERYCKESSSVDCIDPCGNLSGDLRQNVDAWERFIECAAFSS